MAEIVLDGICKTYDKNINVLQDFNLKINDNEFVVLVGPSGCGKSTILNIIAGLENIDKGTLFLDGEPINDVLPKDRDVSMVFQNYALYPHLTVYDNLAFALRIKKMKKDEIDKKVREQAESLGISEYLSRKPAKLSGGQQQRVAIGRALIRNPKVILMDEPLSSLDAQLRTQMRSELLTIKKQISSTVVYVTHDQAEALTLGDSIVVLRDGIINQIGSPIEVYNKPVNLFVAGFIGTPTMNFFHSCELRIEENDYYIFTHNIKIKLDEYQQEILKKRQDNPTSIVMGFRPQHIAIGNGGMWKAKIDSIEMLGSECYVHTKLDDEEIILDVQSIEMDLINNSENSIEFSVFPQLIQLFDKETEENLIWFDKTLHG